MFEHRRALERMYHPERERRDQERDPERERRDQEPDQANYEPTGAENPFPVPTWPGKHQY